MDAPPLDELSAHLGIVLREEELIRQAFVHSSFFNENPALASGHNERLEFYGDAVIGVTVSRLLYEQYPDEDEGFLTARRAALVNREALAELALEIGLDRYLMLGRGETDAGGATRPSVLAASLEALAGALSLVKGPEETDAIIARLFAPRLQALAAISGPPKSAKSLLQEWSQRYRGSKPTYQLIDASGPPHDQIFRVAVSVGDIVLGTGTGTSRQRAEEQAAQVAMAELPDVPEEPMQTAVS